MQQCDTTVQNLFLKLQQIFAGNMSLRDWVTLLSDQAVVEHRLFRGIHFASCDSGAAAH